MSVNEWARSNFRKGINLNSDRLISFAGAIDLEMSTFKDDVNAAIPKMANVPKLFGSNKLGYSCEQSITLPGGLLHFNYLTKDMPNYDDIGIRNNDFDLVFNRKPRKSKTTYNTTKQTFGNDTMPCFAGYQKCSDGGYNIFYIFGTTNSNTPKMATMKNRPRYKDYGEAITDPSKIEGIKLPSDSAPSVFSIIGAPLDEVSLQPITNPGGYVATWYGGAELQTTLYSSSINEPTPGYYFYEGQKVLETFMDVSVYGNADYINNQYKLRRYYMRINHIYLRVTEANDDNTKITTMYHLTKD